MKFASSLASFTLLFSLAYAGSPRGAESGRMDCALSALPHRRQSLLRRRQDLASYLIATPHGLILINSNIEVLTAADPQER